jgi:hypothetical protein
MIYIVTEKTIEGITIPTIDNSDDIVIGVIMFACTILFAILLLELSLSQHSIYMLRKSSRIMTQSRESLHALDTSCAEKRDSQSAIDAPITPQKVTNE